MINFCTLFDSNYLARGLALYDSLQRTCPSFHLYVVAFDDKSFDYLTNAALPNLTAIRQRDFEDDKLLKVKPTRSVAEYCWTCTSSVILYCIQTFNLPSCTYIDADMIFYNDPAVLFEELGEKTVMITKHRYSKEYKRSDINGIYCVQFMYFKNEPNSLAVLQWWRERCLEWCYARLEDGKFGDQKYLDDWPQRFPCVHVLRHLGGGVAPWNVQQYSFRQENGSIHLVPRKEKTSYPVIFFHFHGLKFYTNNKVSCTGSLYDIEKQVKEIFYLPYISKLVAIAAKLATGNIILNGNGAFRPAPSRGKVFLEFVKQKTILVLKGLSSPFPLRQYNFSNHFHFYNLDSFKN